MAKRKLFKCRYLLFTAKSHANRFVFLINFCLILVVFQELFCAFIVQMPLGSCVDIYQNFFVKEKQTMDILINLPRSGYIPRKGGRIPSLGFSVK